MLGWETPSCPCTHCLHTEWPCWGHRCGFLSGVWSPGDPVANTKAIWSPLPRAATQSLGSPGAPHIQAHCPRFWGVACFHL